MLNISNVPVDKPFSSNSAGYRSNQIKSSYTHVAGGSAGASVSITVAFANAVPTSSYNVLLTGSQDAVYFASSKTPAGFTITVNPRLAANTLAIGSVDVLVMYDA